jgi:hypothetical protein
MTLGLPELCPDLAGSSFVKDECDLAVEFVERRRGTG